MFSMKIIFDNLLFKWINFREEYFTNPLNPGVLIVIIFQSSMLYIILD